MEPLGNGGLTIRLGGIIMGNSLVVLVIIFFYSYMLPLVGGRKPNADSVLIGLMMGIAFLITDTIL